MTRRGWRKKILRACFDDILVEKGEFTKVISASPLRNLYNDAEYWERKESPILLQDGKRYRVQVALPDKDTKITSLDFMPWKHISIIAVNENEADDVWKNEFLLRSLTDDAIPISPQREGAALIFGTKDELITLATKLNDLVNKQSISIMDMVQKLGRPLMGWKEENDRLVVVYAVKINQMHRPSRGKLTVWNEGVKIDIDSVYNALLYFYIKDAVVGITVDTSSPDVTEH